MLRPTTGVQCCCIARRRQVASFAAPMLPPCFHVVRLFVFFLCVLFLFLLFPLSFTNRPSSRSGEPASSRRTTARRKCARRCSGSNSDDTPSKVVAARWSSTTALPTRIRWSEWRGATDSTPWRSWRRRLSSRLRFVGWAGKQDASASIDRQGGRKAGRWREGGWEDIRWRCAPERTCTGAWVYLCVYPASHSLAVALSACGVRACMCVRVCVCICLVCLYVCVRAHANVCVLCRRPSRRR